MIKLVEVVAPNLWGIFKDGILKACDGVCEKKRERRNNGNSWGWNEDVKEERSTQGNVSEHY